MGSVNAVAVSSEEIEVTWQVTFDGNLPFQCKVEYRKNASAPWTVTTLQAEPSLSRRVPSLDAFTEYIVRVICQNDVGSNMDPIEETRVRTLQAGEESATR